MKDLRYIGLSAGKEFITMSFIPGLNPCATNRASLRDFRKAIFHFSLFIFHFIAVWAMMGCQQRDLDYDFGYTYNVNVRAEWELEWEYRYEGGVDWQSEWGSHGFGCDYDDLRPAIPDGLRAVVYSDGRDPLVQNLPPQGGEVNLREGRNTLLFYNNDTEFIVFNDVESSVTAKATTRTRTRSTYTGSPYSSPVLSSGTKAEHTVNPPDFLFGHYIADREAVKNDTPTAVPITMRPLVCTYLIRYRFDEGMKYVALARGALAGMAASVFLNDGHTGEEIATVLFDVEGKIENSKSRNSENSESDCIEVLVNSFGAPNYPNPNYSTRADGKYGLNLEVMLKNGKILTFDFDITDQVQAQPRGGVIDVGGIVITQEQGKEVGAFDVEINGWGEYEDVPVAF